MFSLLSDFVFPRERVSHTYESLLIESKNEAGERIFLEFDAPPLHTYARATTTTTTTHEGPRRAVYDARTFYR